MSWRISELASDGGRNTGSSYRIMNQASRPLPATLSTCPAAATQYLSPSRHPWGCQAPPPDAPCPCDLRRDPGLDADADADADAAIDLHIADTRRFGFPLMEYSRKKMSE